MTAQVPEYGGCPWPMDPACKTEEWNAYPADVKARGLALASATLERLTAHRVGECPITVRPCNPHVEVATYAAYSGALYPNGGAYIGMWDRCSTHASACDCGGSVYVALPMPVGRIDSVKVDGVEVPRSAYRLDNGRNLVRMDKPWPVTQDLTKSDAEVGTFSVTYLNAYPVDSLGAYAVGVLAMEFAKMCSGTKCRLPAGVTSISRQGLTMDIPSGVFPDGMTGIREVDSFVALWNPNARQNASRVWSPDRPTMRMQTL